MTNKIRKIKIEFIDSDDVSGDITINLSSLQMVRLLSWFEDNCFDVVGLLKFVGDA